MRLALDKSSVEVKVNIDAFPAPVHVTNNRFNIIPFSVGRGQ